jgi:catechol 2,3-dioxygenase-like lactoylglutathione lyase family enzyme
MPPRLEALDHLVLTVADMDASIAFYTQVLGCTEVSYGAGRKALRFGSQKINLHPYPLRSDIALVAAHPTPGSGDLCFLSSTPVAEWMAHLERAGVPIEAAPSQRVGATGTLLSIYIRDPDRNLIEISNLLPD